MKRTAIVLFAVLVMPGVLTGCSIARHGSENSGLSTNEKDISSNREDEGDSSKTGACTEADFAVSAEEMFTNRDYEIGYSENGCIRIELHGNTAAASDNSVKIDGSMITITKDASYIISGKLDDGTVTVNVSDTAKIQIVLDGADITSTSSAPLYVLEADKVFLTTAPDSVNVLSSGEQFIAVDENNIDAAIFSKQDLTLNGLGSLTVNAPAGHGIVSKDDLVITSGAYTINAASHGLDANDSVRIVNAEITVTAGKDGIHAENKEDASKGFVKVGKNNKLRASDIKKMVDTVVNRLDVDKYSRVVSRDEIRANDYNLNIPRYVDSSEAPETWDIYASMFGGIPPHEVLELNKYWKAFPSLQENIFAQNSSGYYSVLHQDVKSVTNENVDIVSFKNKYKEAFSDLKNILKQHLISNMNTVNVAKEENVLSENIFSRLQNIPLIDKYNAYQILDDEWFKIAIDLEIIQTEGFTSTKKVDPNIVIKKKDGKEQEVQEGWIGRVLPFDLIQQTILKTETDALVSKNNRVAEISSLYEEILDSLSEDEKENSIVNDDKDAFVAAEITKAVKQIKAEYKGVKFEEDTYEYKVLKVADLIAEEKDLKSKIKKETADLQMKTKDIIENLTDEQVLELLEIKWINPLVSALDKLPDSIIHELSIKIKALAEKYAVTFSEVEEEIVDTEATLSSMIDELVGNEFDMKGLEEFKSLLKGA